MARCFESIALANFLSFGPEPTVLKLGDVNVLVGPNGAGKSNLIEALNVLRHAPRDIGRSLREGGGVREYLWKPAAEAAGAPAPVASIEVEISAGLVAATPTRYRIAFSVEGGRLVITDERVEETQPRPGYTKPFFYYGYENGRPMINLAEGSRRLIRDPADPTSSILALRKDPDSYPEITRLGELLDGIGVYRHWVGGPMSPLRLSCRADVPTERLIEGLDNLPARLAALKRDPAVKAALKAKLTEVSPGFDDIEITPEGGALQLYLQDGPRMISSYRLSDGTLRYLMLLAVLLDPSPPPLVLIEEPECSLHPDVLPTLRDLILDAGQRTQIIVTTQSPTFLDAWTDHAASVVMCDRVGDATSLIRVDPSEFPSDGEGLGSRWLRGEIGGTRW
jgi:predicted ATPase